MISLKLDASKIDKERIFHGRTGAKYIDLVLIENRGGTDQYGNDGFVKQECTKEERTSGNPPQMPIIGNYRVIKKRVERPLNPMPVPKDLEAEEVPF